MKKILLGFVALWLASSTQAHAQNTVPMEVGLSCYTGTAWVPCSGNSNPTSTLQMVSGTGAYTAGNLIASSGTAGSVVVPSFKMPNTTGIISRLRLTNNDATSTAWGAQTVTVDLWSVAPTFTNGDRAAYLPATGTAGHLGSFTCVLSAEYGDGVYSECAPAVGSAALVNISSTSVFWTLTATTGSGTTGASKVFTLTAEVLN